MPFGEISVYRSDPRHVAKLMSRSDGLGARLVRPISAVGASFSGFRDRGAVVSNGGWYGTLRDPVGGVYVLD